MNEGNKAKAHSLQMDGGFREHGHKEKKYEIEKERKKKHQLRQFDSFLPCSISNSI